MTGVTVCCLLSSGALFPSQEKGPPPFQLRADVVSALEGGPVVVKLTLRYQGEGPIQTGRLRTADYWSSSGLIQPPDTWVPAVHPPRPRILCGIDMPTDTFHPGEELRRTFYLHRDYCSIPSGKAVLKCQWSVYGPGKSGRAADGGPLLAAPSTTVTVDVPPATPRRAEAMARDLLSVLTGPDISTSADRERLVENTITCTPHEAFVPVALRLIRGQRCPSGDLLDFVSDCSSSPTRGHRHLVAELLRDDPLPATQIFQVWADRLEHKLLRFEGRDFLSPAGCFGALVGPYCTQRLFVRSVIDDYRHLQAKSLCYQKEGLSQLARASNPRVRLLTLVTFGRALSSRQRIDLTVELQRIGRAVPVREWQDLLAQLEDERFSVREKATAALLTRGDAIVPQLQKALQGPASPEARARIESLLANFRENPLAPLEPQTLSFFEYFARGQGSALNSDARAALKSLAESDQNSSLGRAAREALARLDARAEQPARKER